MADEPTAGESLKLARQHLGRAQSAAWGDVDWTDLSTYGFYCLEAGVVAAATHVEMKLVRSHQGKADAARELAKKHKLPDVSELLGDLNTARKAYCYGGIEAPEHLEPENLSELLETFVDAVDQLLKTKKVRKKHKK